MDQYTVNCLEDLSKVMTQDESIRKYLSEQPGPTYQFARFTDWIRPYLDSQLVNSTASNYNDTYHSSIRETVNKVLDNYQIYEASLREIDANESPVELHKGEPVIRTTP